MTPRVTFLHGALALGRAWDPLRALLPPHDGAAPDLPGHGRAPDWSPDQGDYHDLSTATARQAMGQGPCHLVGHSFGATVALRLALEQPGQVQSLTLVEPILFSLVAPDSPEARQTAALFAPVQAHVAAGRPEEAARHFLSHWGDGTPWEALPDRSRAALVDRMGVLVAADATILPDRMGLTLPGRIEGLVMPLTLVTGGAAPPIMPAIARALVASNPGFRWHQVAGAGHMLPLTHPADLAAILAPGLAPVPA